MAGPSFASYWRKSGGVTCERGMIALLGDQLSPGEISVWRAVGQPQLRAQMETGGLVFLYGCLNAVFNCLCSLVLISFLCLVSGEAFHHVFYFID